MEEVTNIVILRFQEVK